jgi:hypothetical protein
MNQNQEGLKKRVNEFIDKGFKAVRLCDELGIEKAYFCRWRHGKAKDMKPEHFKALDDWLDKRMQE